MYISTLDGRFFLIEFESPILTQGVLERLDEFLEHRLKGIRHLKDIVRTVRAGVPRS